MRKPVEFAKDRLIQTRIDGPAHQVLSDVAREMGITIGELNRRIIYEALTPFMEDVFNTAVDKDTDGTKRIKRGKVRGAIKRRILQKYK
jgi:antitoxin component of RelBE/YafQ-DinJ toxin-antitoxin module